MPVPILILLIAASAVLVAEYLLTAAAGLTLYQPGIARFTQVTGYTPSPEVYRALGALALIGVLGVILGMRWPVLGIVAGAYFAVVAGFTLVRQVQLGQRGQELLPYSLFLACAVAVIVIHVRF